MSRGLRRAGRPPGLVRGPPLETIAEGGVPEQQGKRASIFNNVIDKWSGLHVPKPCMGLDSLQQVDVLAISHQVANLSTPLPSRSVADMSPE